MSNNYEVEELAPIREQLLRVGNEAELHRDEVDVEYHPEHPCFARDIMAIIDHCCKMASQIKEQREELVALRGANFRRANAVCSKCDGDKLVADTEDEEPWSQWTDLPVKSAGAVLAGIVKPKPCPRCSGTGREP